MPVNHKSYCAVIVNQLSSVSNELQSSTAYWDPSLNYPNPGKLFVWTFHLLTKAIAKGFLSLLPQLQQSNTHLSEAQTSNAQTWRL